MTHNPRMHLGIKINPCMQTGIAQIPVCLQGSHDMLFPYAYGDWSWSPYAYKDLRNPHMHTGMAWHIILIPIVRRGLLKGPSLYAYGDLYVHSGITICILGSLYAYMVRDKIQYEYRDITMLSLYYPINNSITFKFNHCYSCSTCCSCGSVSCKSYQPSCMHSC